MTRSKTFTFWLIVCFQIIVILVMVGLKQSVILYGKTIILKTQPVDPHSLFQGDYARLSFAINNIKTQKFKEWQPGNNIYTELKPSVTSWNLVGVHHKIPEKFPENNVILKGIIRSEKELKGYPVFDLKDFSNHGWLNTQPDTATWRQILLGPQQEVWYDTYKKDLAEGTTVFISLDSYDNKYWSYYRDISESSNTIHHYASYNRILTGKLGPYKEQKILNVSYGIESYFIPEGKGKKYEKPDLDVEIAVNNKGQAVVKKVILP